MARAHCTASVIEIAVKGVDVQNPAVEVKGGADPLFSRVSTFRMPPLKLKKPTLSNVDPLCTVSVPPLRLKVLELDMAVDR